MKLNLPYLFIFAGAVVLFILFKKFMGKADDHVASAISDGAILLDVRTPSEFRSGSADGAVNIPLNELDSRWRELNPEKPIVVFCASGIRSKQAKSILTQKGLTRVFNGGTWQGVNKMIRK